MSVGLTTWFTGLPAAGKTTLAHDASALLEHRGHKVTVLDGDQLRQTISRDLGFSLDDRREAIRRAGELSLELAGDGQIVLVAMVSPLLQARSDVRELHRRSDLGFLEVWVATPLDVCQLRDPKHLYERARIGEITDLSGVGSPYEPPLDPELVI